MKKLRDTTAGDLLSGFRRSSTSAEALAQGATLLRGFASSDATALMKALEQVLVAAPFRHMVTPGGFRMSVAMSNCGRAGWVTDRTGYRYYSGRPDHRTPLAANTHLIYAPCHARCRCRRVRQASRLMPA